MAAFLHEITVDLRKRPQIFYLGSIMYEGDALADTISVTVLDDGETASLSGNVTCKVVRADSATVYATGNLSGNVATVTLPASAYAITGTAKIMVTLTSGSTITTLVGCVANVVDSTTDTVVDPGTIIPSVEALIAEIENVRESIPSDYSTLAAQVQTNTTNMGSLADLDTTAKNNLVAAINEAAQSGGSGEYDSSLSSSSENAVQNKVVTQALADKMNVPVSGGTAGQCIMSDGEGNMVWGTPTEVSVVLGDLALKDRATASYTPSGSVSAPTVTVTPTTVERFLAQSATGGGSVSAGTAASCTFPSLTMNVENEVLSLFWTAGTFATNTPTSVTLPTFASTQVVTGATASASQPTFTGTAATITST